MTCSKCEKHGYTVSENGQIVLKIDNGDSITGLARLKLYTHYCTMNSIRKIKFDADWHGGEWPKWCPLRGGEQAEKRQAANYAAEAADEVTPA